MESRNKLLSLMDLQLILRAILLWQLDFDKTGWVIGNSNYIVQVGFDSRYQAAYQEKKLIIQQILK